MAGILGNAPLTSDISLLLEIAVIIALFVGRFRFARNKRFTAHGFTLTFAVILHAVAVLLVMIPSLVSTVDFLISDLSNPVVIITWIHAPLGLVVLILGIYLVLGWRFQSPNASCYKRAKLMRPLWVLWILSMILGVLIYIAIAVAS